MPIFPIPILSYLLQVVGVQSILQVPIPQYTNPTLQTIQLISTGELFIGKVNPPLQYPNTTLLTDVHSQETLLMLKIRLHKILKVGELFTGQKKVSMVLLKIPISPTIQFRLTVKPTVELYYGIKVITEQLTTVFSTAILLQVQ